MCNPKSSNMAADRVIHNVTFAGLGQMGSALLGLAMRAGYTVAGADPRRSGDLLDRTRFVSHLDDTPMSDCLCLCLPGPAEYLAAIDWVAQRPIARRPHTLINLTTVGPAATAEATRTLERHCPEVWHAECPLTGGVRQASEGGTCSMDSPRPTVCEPKVLLGVLGERDYSVRRSRRGSNREARQ